MSDQLASLRDFLEERNLARKDDRVLAAQTRNRLEQSKLLEMVDATCTSLNCEAGSALIEAYSYLPPEPVVRSFTYVQGQTEIVMRLEVWRAKPALLFLVRKWRDISSNGFVRWIYRLSGIDPLTVDMKFAGEIQEEAVSEQEVRRWFFYLLSGLSRSYMPSLKRLEGSLYTDNPL